MEEKAFKTMGAVGVFNLVLGVITIAGGIAAGIMLIINGSRSLANRKNLLI